MNPIKISEKAIKHFSKKLSEAGENSFVLISTKKSGCSGLSYVTEIKTGALDAEVAQVHTDLPIYIENKNLAYLEGMVLDYQTEGLQSKLVYINPNETGRCGCGESFSVK